MSEKKFIERGQYGSSKKKLYSDLIWFFEKENIF
jgi:hypothetical protein